MKTVSVGLILIFLTSSMACQKSEVVSEFTGNQASYGLIQTSAYPVSGTVTFKERKDGTTTVLIQLNGTSGSDRLPVHLHRGSAAANALEVVVPLNTLNASTGVSTTVVSQLTDGTKISYSDLLKVSGYVNVHASSGGPESAVILVAGNVGTGMAVATVVKQFGNCNSGR
ncbi:MAG: hypothetical protein JSS93_09405 [Bacteroidetes bacterium]|nr:hypothetical protein [Bacteroidota bacterium]